MQGDGQAAPSDARLDQSTIYQRLSQQGVQSQRSSLVYDSCAQTCQVQNCLPTANQTMPEPMTKSYTYQVHCTFTVQFTFSEREVKAAEEGTEGDVDPTQEALDGLAAELQECLSQNFSVTDVQAHADFDDLLGVNSEDDVPDVTSN